MATTVPILAVQGLTVSVAGTVLLRGVHFALDEADVVALQGPSGTGKTTLLRTMAGLRDATAGDVLMDGKEAEEHGYPAYRRMLIYVAQEAVAYDETVAGCLERPFWYRSRGQGRGHGFDATKACTLLAQVGLDDADIMERRVRQLSVGERQRVSLVRALLLEPRVLLLDEPTSALDQDTAHQVMAVLTDWATRRRGALLIALHDRGLAERFCTRRIDLSQWLATRLPGSIQADVEPGVEPGAEPGVEPGVASGAGS